MSTATLVGPQTAAAANLVLNTDSFTSTVLFADGLAAAEEVDIKVAGGLTPVVYAVGGAAVKLTATQPFAILPQGPTYLIDKDATAGLCGVYAAQSSNDH